MTRALVVSVVDAILYTRESLCFTAHTTENVLSQFNLRKMFFFAVLVVPLKHLELKSGDGQMKMHSS